MPAEDAVVLLTSTEPDRNKSFGTAFIIAHDQNYSYLLTCAHVVEQINGKNAAENKLKISGLDKSVEILRCGSGNGIDMALLKVADLFDVPLFRQFIFGRPGSDIFINGYKDFQSLTQSKQVLEGRLGNTIKLNAQGIEFPAWDINIRQNDIFARLAPGYSGSPVYNSKNEILGIMSHMLNGEAGYAICISNLKILYPEILKLIPDFDNQLEKSRKGNYPPQNYSPDPSFLPYLLDREPQEYGLIDAIAKHSNFEQPLLCIIQGSDEDCCSERFVQRIARYVLPQIPVTRNQIKDDNYRISFVQTGDFKNSEQLHRNMKRSLGENFAHNKIADFTEINEALAAERRPILLYATLSTEDCQNLDGVEILRNFFRFWQNGQHINGKNYLILVCLFFYYQPCHGNFLGRILGKKDLNTQIEQMLPELDAANCAVLPKLEPIKYNHLEDWSESDVVRNFFNRPIHDEVLAEVRSIYQQQKTEEIALGYLARKLIPFLKQLVA